MRLRYWIKSALNVTVGTLIGSVGYAVMMTWGIGDFSVQKCLCAAALFAVGIGGFFSLLMNISVYAGMLPVCLSFGSTRKEALLGLQLYRLIPATICSVLAAVVLAFVKGKHEVPSAMVFCVGISLFLILGAWGSVAGILQTKYGNKAGVTAVLVGFVVLILIAAMIAMVALASTEEQFIALLFSPFLYGGLLLVGIAVHCLCLLLERKTINQYSVKL